MALILKTIINSGTGSVYNYLSERKKGWNQILFYDHNKLKPSRKFLFNTVDSKFSYCAYFKCHVTENDSSWSQAGLDKNDHDWLKMYINSYWQIMENSSRKFSEIFIFRIVTQAVLLESSSNFCFEISILGRHTDRFTGKLIH